MEGNLAEEVSAEGWIRTLSRVHLQIPRQLDEPRLSHLSGSKIERKDGIPCATRLFAVRSSLPIVTLTGSFWNVAASLLTASGQVALTIHPHTKVNKMTD